MLIRNNLQLLVKLRTSVLRDSCKRGFQTSEIKNDSNLKKKVIAIRREDQSLWERRAPLSPNHVRKLVNKNGIRVLIQPSNRRAFQIQEYIRAGAEVSEDLQQASLILGVKQVPIDLLLPNKTYVFFSHTIKAQEANMSLLDALLEKVNIFKILICIFYIIFD
jgi:alpha-aminoadipic semialdehyde synthase